MSALEAEVLQKLIQLDRAAQKRIIETAAVALQEEDDQPDPWTIWLDEAHQLRETLRMKYGRGTGIDVTALVREVRASA